MKHAPTGALTRASLLACASLCATVPAFAAKTWTGGADATWANTANWLEAALPGTIETVIFDANSAANLAIDTGANRIIRGITVSNPFGPVTLQNNVVTIGGGGIDMSAAVQNLTLASPNNVIQSGAFKWNVPVGRTLAFAAVPHRNSPVTYGGGNNDNVGGIVRVATTGTVNLTTPNLLVVSDAIAGSGSNGGNNPFMTYGDDAFAATDASGNVIAATNVAWGASVGNAFSGSPGEVTASFTQNGNGGFQGIVFKDATAAHTVSLQGSTTFTGRAVLMAPGCLGGTITGGFLRANRSNTGGVTFSFVQNSTDGDLTIGSVISTASSGTPTAITKSGAGKLIFTGNNGYSGRTFIHEGTLQVGAGGTTGTLSGGNVINNAALVIDRADAIAAGQIISGTGTLTKQGFGTLTLGNASTYTGATTINGGLVSIGAAASFGATSSLTLDGGGIQWSAPADISVFPVTIGSGGTTFDTNGQAVALASPIGNSGSGAVVKIGAGSLSLGGANLYNGGTTVSGGTLLATNATGSATGSGWVTVQTGGGLGGNGFITGAVTVEAGANVAPGTSVGTLTVGSLDLDPGSTLDFEFGTGNDQITVTDAGGLNIDGGAITLRQEGTANAFAAVGTYKLIAYSGTLGGAATNLSVANPQPGFGYTFGTAGGFVTLTIATTGVVREWIVDGGGSWADNANWNGTFPNSTSATANFHVNLTGPAIVTLDGSRTVGAITFLSGANGYTIAPGTGGSLVLNNGASNSSILDGDGVHTISAPLTLTSNTVVNTAAADDGIILGGAVTGGGTLTKTGPGSLDLQASNGFTGALTLSGGTTTFASGGLGAGDLTLGASKLVWASGNTEDISNRAITFDSGTIEFDVGFNDVSLANAIGNFGFADLVKSGDGKLTLGADSTFTGNVTLAAGTLQLGTGGTGGAVSGDIVNNGVLIFDRSDTYQTFGAITGTGSLLHDGTGILELGGTNTFTGPTSITEAAGSISLVNGLGLQGSTLNYPAAGGSLTFASSTAATLGGLDGDKSLALTNADTLPVALTVGGNNESTAYAGILSGDGSLTKIGTGTLTLGSVAHTYTGATTVNGGVLELPAGGSIATTAANVGVGGKLHITGGSLTSSVFSTYQNGGIAITLDSGSLAFNGGVQSSQNDGSLMEIWGGTFSALDVILRRSGIYNNDANGNPNPAMAGNNGFVVNGGTATITNTLQVGTGNSSASALVTGGSLSVGGVVTLGNTTHGSRWSILEARGGTFTSTEAASGIVLSSNAGTANYSMFLVSGGTATVERVAFGTATSAAGTGRVAVTAGELHVGSGGLVQDAPAFTSQVQLFGGILGAKATWSSSLDVETANTFTIQTADTLAAPFDITLSGAVTGTGSLVKTGAGTLTLSGAHAYTGSTEVDAGILVLSAATLADTATVDISAAGSGVIHLPHGQTDLVADYLIDGVSQGPGLYTAANSGGRITGTGSLEVIASDPFAAWISGFAVGGLTAKTDDPDGDGQTNLEEFGLDGDPSDGAASGKVRARIETVGAGQALVITLPVRNGATFDNLPGPSADATIDDVAYTILGSNNLSLFDQGVTEIPASTTGMPVLNEGWTYHSFRLDGAIGGATPRGPKGFLSVDVADAP